MPITEDIVVLKPRSLESGNLEPEVSVIIPFDDERADAKHLISWARKQTFEASRFEIIVLSDGRDPIAEEEMLKFLRPQDSLMRATGYDRFHMYNLGANLAHSGILLLTEDHCVAAPRCVEEAANYLRMHGAEAVTLNSGHINHSDVGRFEQREMEKDAIVWNEPGHWNKLRVRGFAIRRDTFLRASGFPPEYGLFSEAVLAARLHGKGVQIGFNPVVCVSHINTRTVREYKGFVESYSGFECLYCENNATGLSERYFQVSTVLLEDRIPASEAQQLPGLVFQALLREVRQRTGRSLQDLTGWVLLLIRAACISFATRHLMKPMARLWVLSARVRFFLWKSRKEKRYRAFEDFRAALVHETRVKSFACRGDNLARSNLNAIYEGASLERLRSPGTYPLERHEGKVFRWTGPFASIAFNLADADYHVSLDTGQLRGDAAGLPVAFVWNRHLVPKEKINFSGGSMRFSIPRAWLLGNSRQVLTILSLADRKTGVDRRLRGVPIVSLKIERNAPAVQDDLKNHSTGSVDYRTKAIAAIPN